MKAFSSLVQEESNEEENLQSVFGKTDKHDNMDSNLHTYFSADNLPFVATRWRNKRGLSGVFIRYLPEILFADE
jgi:hypothetical protein